jgi:hypothetical protein
LRGWLNNLEIGLSRLAVQLLPRTLSLPFPVDALGDLFERRDAVAYAPDIGAAVGQLRLLATT